MSHELATEMFTNAKITNFEVMVQEFDNAFTKD